MSDSIADIPLVVSISQESISKLERLQQLLETSLNEMNKIEAKDGKLSPFNTRLVGVFFSQLESIEKIIQKISNTGELNKLGADAARVGKAIEENIIQKLLQSESALGRAAGSKSFDRLTAATEAYGRQIDQTKLKIIDLEKAQKNAASGELKGLESQITAQERHLLELEARRSIAQGNLNNVRQEARIESGVNTRAVVAPEVARRFQATTQGQALLDAERAKQIQSAGIEDFRRDQRTLATSQRIERGTDFSAATNEDRTRTRADNQLRTAEVQSAQADDRLRTAKLDLERTAQVQAAQADDQARTRAQNQVRTAEVQSAQAEDRLRTSKANTERTAQVQAAQAEDRGRTDRLQRDRATLVESARAEDRQRTERYRLLRRADVEAATAEERDRVAFAKAHLAAMREDFRRNPENIIANRSDQAVDRATVARGLAADPQYIAAQAELKQARDDLRRSVRAAQPALPPVDTARQAQDDAALYRSRQARTTARNEALGPDAPQRAAPKEPDTLVEQLGRRGSVLAQYAVLGAAFAGIEKTVESVIHLENALKELGAVSGATNIELSRMRDVIIDTSTKTPFTGKEIADLARELAQAGVSSHEITASLGAITTLAAATGGHLKEVGAIFSSAFEVFKINGSESVKIADQLAITLDKSRLGVDNFARVLETTSTTAVENGLSFTQLQSTLAALSNQGLRSGTILSTGFRQILVDLKDPPKKLADRFKELGISLSDTDVSVLGTTGVLHNLAKAGFTTADAFATLPARTAQAFAAFLKSGGDIAHFNELLANAGGAADQTAVRMESLQNQALRLGNQFIAVTQNATGPLVGILKLTAGALTSVFKTLEDTGKGTSVVSTILLGVGVTSLGRYLFGLTAVKSAMVAVNNAGVAMVAGVEAVGSASGRAAVGMKLFALASSALPFIAITTAISVVIGLLGEAGNSSGVAAEKMDRLKTAVSDAAAKVDEKSKSLEALNRFIEQTIAKEKILVDGSDQLKGAVNEARSAFGNLSDKITESIGTFSTLIAKLRETRSELKNGLVFDINASLGALRTLQTEQRVVLAGVGGPVQADRAMDLLGQRSLPAMTEDGSSPENNHPRSAMLRGQNAAFKSVVDVIQAGGSATSDQLTNASNILEAARIAMPGRKAELEQLQAQLNTIRSAQQAERGTTYEIGRKEVSAEQGNFNRRSDIADIGTDFESATAKLRRLEHPRDLGDTAQLRQDAAKVIIAPVEEIMKRGAALRATLHSDAERTLFDESDFGKAMADAAAKIKTSNAALVRDVAAQTVHTATLTATEAAAGLRATEKELPLTRDTAARKVIIDRAKAEVERIAQASRDRINAAAEGSEENSAKDKPIVERDRGIQLRGVEETRTSQLETIQRTENTEQIRRLKEANAVLEEQIKTSAQRVARGGVRRGTVEDRKALDAKVIANLKEIGKILNQSDEETNGEIERRNQRAIRRETTIPSSAGSRRDPNRTFNAREPSEGAQVKSQVETITKDEESKVRQSRLALTQSETYLKAAEETHNFPQGRLIQLRKIVFDQRIAQEEAELKIRQTTTKQLVDIQATQEKALSDATSLLEELKTKYSITGKGESLAGNFGSEETRRTVLTQFDGLQRAVTTLGGADGTGGELQKIREQIQKDKDVAETLVAKIGARKEAKAGTGATGLDAASAGFGQAVEGFKQKVGYGDGDQTKAAADVFENILLKANSGFSTFIQNLVTGADKGKSSFKGLVTSILQDALKMVTDKAVSQLFGAGLNAIMSLAGGGGGGGGGGGWAGLISQAVGAATVALGGGSAGGADTTGKTGGSAEPKVDAFGGSGTSYNKQAAYTGGIIRRRYQTGGMVPGVHYGRDTVPAMLAPGEGVLNRSAVSLVGEDMVAKLNSGALTSQPTVQPPPPRQPDNVNVYVMDKNTQPTLGPKDILATVHQDILTGGATKKLIQQVQVGG